MADDGGFERVSDAAAGFTRVAPARRIAEGFTALPPPPTANSLTGIPTGLAPKANPGFFDKLLGLGGTPRVQTWPERIVRGGLETAHGDRPMESTLGYPGTLPPGTYDAQYEPNMLGRAFGVKPFVAPSGESDIAGAQDIASAALLSGPPRVGPKGIAQAPAEAPRPVEAGAPANKIDLNAPSHIQQAQRELQNLPPVPANHVRFYHGGDNPTSGGGRWVANDYIYARDYRPGQSVHYVDIPKGHPAEMRARKWDAIDEQNGINNVGTYASFEVPSDLAAQMKPIAGASPAASTGGFTPVPTAAPPANVLRRGAQTAEKIFSPETVDANAGKAVELIRSATGRAARDTAVTDTALEPFHRRVNELPPERQLEFVDYIENRSKRDPLADAPFSAQERTPRNTFGEPMNARPSYEIKVGPFDIEIGPLSKDSNVYWVKRVERAGGVKALEGKGLGPDAYQRVATFLEDKNAKLAPGRGPASDYSPGGRSIAERLKEAGAITPDGNVIPKSTAAKQLDPKLQQVADALRTAFETRKAKIEKMPEFEHVNFVEDYFPHFWKDPNKANEFLNAYRGAASKQGSGASLKTRTMPTIADGIRAGLEPVSTSPIDGALRYVQSMDQFLASAEIRSTAKDLGMIRYVRPRVMGASGHPDSFKIPEGWAPLKGRGSTDATGAQAYAPEGFARVYNNFISRGFADIGAEYGHAMTGARRASNAVTALELGLSGYHALTMAQESMVNSLSNALSSLRAGKPLSAIKSAIETPAAPVTYAMKGKKLADVYLNRVQGSSHAREIADLLAEGGGRGNGARHAPDYEFSRQGSYVTAFKRGALKAQLLGDAKDIAGRPINGTLAAGARHVGRIMDTVAQPLFEKYIPAVKNGAFYENMSAWLQQNPGASREQQVRAARQILDSVDNRFGEMVQDNVFWNKALKEVAMLSLRSWSWTVGGAFREIGGGVRDTLRAPFKSRNPEEIGPNDKRWTQKMDYVIALPIVYGGLSAAYQYLKTGKPPADARDLLAPRTGGTDANSGEPERLLIPGYMKDVFGFIEHPWQEMKYKAATAPTKVLEVIENKNWRGDPIRSPRDKNLPLVEQGPQWLRDYFKYATESFGPISVRNAIRGGKTGTNLSTLELALGVRTAPRQFIDPEGYEKMKEGIGKRDWQKKLRFEQREKNRYGGTE